MATRRANTCPVHVLWWSGSHKKNAPLLPQVGGGSGDGLTSKVYLLQQALEAKSNELMATQKFVQDLRKRERELTDR